MKSNRRPASLAILMILLVSQILSSFVLQGNLSVYAEQQNTTTISQSGKTIVFQAQNIAITFSSSTGSILSIRNLLTGQLTQLSGSYPLWVINTPNVTYTTTNANKFSFVIDTEGSRLLMSWSIPTPGFAVLVQVEGDPGNGGVDMQINVQNLNSHITIRSVRFPYIAGFSKLGSSPFDNLAVPRLDGSLIQDFQQSLKNHRSFETNYPGALSMQFFLIYDDFVGGIYEGVQDPNSYFKSLEITNYTYSAPLFKFDWINFPSDIYPGNQFAMNYSVTLAGFAGEGWEDGAQLYKSWATKQWYVERGPVVNRSDIPNWFKQIGLMWKGAPLSQMANVTLSVKQNFPNESVLLDWWGWNNGGFDHGYPEYFPPTGGSSAFEDAINQIHADGAKVILFFSGRLVDINTTTFEQNQQYMIINQTGGVHLEKFLSGMTAATPNPTSAWWQSEVVNFTTTAVKDYGVDGVYLDAVARASPIIDYRNATHPALTGSEWWKAYAQIFMEVTNSIRQYNPTAIISSEGVSEVYIPYLSGFWDNFDRDNSSKTGIIGALQIPLFSYVYHEYALVYGTPGFPYLYPQLFPNKPPAFSSIYNLYPQLFRYELSKITTYGLIIRPDLHPYIPILPNDSTFLLKMVTTEQTYSQYLRFSDELPSPVTLSQNVSFVFPKYNNNLTVSAVTTGLYRASNGSNLLLIVNPTVSAKVVGLRFYPSEFGGQTLGGVKLCSTNSSTSNCFLADKNGDINVTVGALSYVALTIYPTINLTTSAGGSSQPLPLIYWVIIGSIGTLSAVGLIASYWRSQIRRQSITRHARTFRSDARSV